MKNFCLSPERTELLKQAINIMFINCKTANNKRPREEVAMSVPASPIFGQSPPGSPRNDAPPSPKNKPMKRNQLSSWMCTQRQDNKSGELPEYRIKLLNLTGFVWSKQHKQQQQQRGVETMSLEETLAVERELLSTHEVTSLSGRSKRNHELWMIRFHELLAFKRTHGHLKVPTLVEDE